MKRRVAAHDLAQEGAWETAIAAMRLVATSPLGEDAAELVGLPVGLESYEVTGHGRSSR
jgi:hypothetical protein